MNPCTRLTKCWVWENIYMYIIWLVRAEDILHSSPSFQVIFYVSLFTLLPSKLLNILFLFPLYAKLCPKYLCFFFFVFQSECPQPAVVNIKWCSVESCLLSWIASNQVLARTFPWSEQICGPDTHQTSNITHQLVNKTLTSRPLILRFTSVKPVSWSRSLIRRPSLSQYPKAHSWRSTSFYFIETEM